MRERAGVFGGYSLEEYKATIPAAEFEALCKEAKSKSPGGAKRGPKPYETWDVLLCRCIAWLFDDDVGAHTNVNESAYAKRLGDWGVEHLDEDDVPAKDYIRAKVGDWVKSWKRMKELEDEAKRKADR